MDIAGEINLKLEEQGKVQNSPVKGEKRQEKIRSSPVKGEKRQGGLRRVCGGCGGPKRVEKRDCSGDGGRGVERLWSNVLDLGILLVSNSEWDGT